ncbi:DNA ligase, partial [Rhodococcus fascians]|nr:DNA ligase [Rhodococcus fascians]
MGLHRFLAADRTRADSSGQRGVSVVDGTSRVKLFSRNGNDISASFPDVAAALADTTAGRSVTLDGELVALDSGGRPDFGLLQR